MTDYTELLELLRYCSSESGCIGCKLSEAYDCTADLTRDAAAAIEALQAEIRESMQKCAECGDRMVEPKQGEWIEDTITYAGPGLSNYKCSLCGKICGTWRMGLKPGELPNWCGNCGADMRAKMEVQE